MGMINASLLWTCFSSFTSKSNSNSPGQLMKGAALSYWYVLLEWQAKSWIWFSVILDQKQKPWNVPCSFSFKTYAFSLRWAHILQPLIHILFSILLVKSFNLIILEGIHSLIYVFIQHIEPIQSFDAEPSVGSRKKKLKANAQRAKKYHQDRMRSEPFLILLLFFLLFIICSHSIM
jgi:hypothetical protein